MSGPGYPPGTANVRDTLASGALAELPQAIAAAVTVAAKYQRSANGTTSGYI
jgi:hypothetical protein